MNIRKRIADPRYYQIAVLSSLALFGAFVLDIGIRWDHGLSIVATALTVQFIASHWLRLPRFDPLSPLITSLSLTLLLRTDLVLVAMTAAAIAIGSKFLLRINDKHIFNPANVAIVTLVLLTDHAWLSSGQWGNAALGAFAVACLGFVVLTRARRAETTFAFLGFYAALLFGRALWLGDPLTIPVHQLQSGALMIFAFFMISDPKTSPDTAVGRVLYGAVVASVAYIIQFVLYHPHGPIFALILCAPLVPSIDLLLEGRRYRWREPVRVPVSKGEGVIR